MMQRLAIRLLASMLLCVACAAAGQSPTSNVAEGITPSRSGEEFTLNFKDAKIQALIATVSELTGRNFVVDPRVRGEVTVLSSHPMTAEELYQTFLSVLEVHGFAAVPAGAVTKIVPQVNAKQAGAFGDDVDTPEDMVTRVIQVSNVPAAQLVPILRPLVPQYGHLAAYPASNILIISDRRANVERIRRIVEAIDQEGNRRVEIIELEHAYAGEVVRILQKLKSQTKQAGANGANFTAIAVERTNSIILAAGPEIRLRLQAIIADLDTPVKSEGSTEVVYLDYADAEKLAGILQKFAETLSNRAGRQGKGPGDVSVIAAKGANALVINAPPSAMREIRQVIEQLDIRRGQVLIEAIIAEVTLSQARELGINVGVLSDDTGIAASILDKSTLQIIPAIASGATPLNLIQKGLNIALGSAEGGDGFGLLLRAFAGNSRTNVLSTPSIVTRDNEKAVITVGKVVPFVTGRFTSAVTGGGPGITNPFQTIERKNVGLRLELTPQINAGNTIQLELALEVSSIAKSATAAADLITKKRTLETSVTVESGQILVLGGLISTQLTESTQKVPVLSEIPIIGALFKTQSVKRVKRNLLNFIQATILSDGAANYYTRQKYQYMRNLQQSQKASIPLMPDAKRPVLPPIERYMHTPVFPESAKRGTESTEVRSKETAAQASVPSANRKQYQR